MTNLQVQKAIEWGLVVFVVTTAVGAWWQVRAFGAGAELTLLNVFPLLGLLAFGLMWTHFVSGATRRLLGLKARRSVYWKLSSGLVLVLIIMHPSLLNIGLVRDGLGLPPGSYEVAYGMLVPWLFVGWAALLVFLAFELHRWYRKKSWWKYVEWAQLVAMAAIFVHALMLGAELSLPWFMAVWWGMGLTFVASVSYTKYSISMNRRRKRE